MAQKIMWRRKVLWSEGLFLRPQHFQQQERYLENLIERRTRAIRSYGWGFEALELDEAAGAIGNIALRQASGILPDRRTAAVSTFLGTASYGLYVLHSPFIDWAVLGWATWTGNSIGDLPFAPLAGSDVGI